MKSLNTEWALGELDQFLRLSDRPRGGDIYSVNGSVEDLTRQAYVVEQVLDSVFPGWRSSQRSAGAYESDWLPLREQCLRAKEAIARRDEIQQNLGDDSPEMSASSFHRWIWSGASSLWSSGHYREAVEAAAKKLNAETQNKVGRRGISEGDLFKQAFSLNAPSSGQARLRRMASENGKTFESVQRGAMALAEGVFAGIRNPLAHEADVDLNEQTALEYLATLSVLARWVDEAEVERVDGEEPA